MTLDDGPSILPGCLLLIVAALVGVIVGITIGLLL